MRLSPQTLEDLYMAVIRLEDERGRTVRLLPENVLQDWVQQPRAITEKETTMDLPLYKCHKEVRAAKIVEIEDGGVLRLAPVDGNEVTVTPGPAWVSRHNPEVGGFFVRYEGDGYESYSPAKAFEDGYTRVV